MNKKIQALIEIWKNINKYDQYTDEQITSIIINCLSISKTWFDNNKPVEKESYELRLYNSDDVLIDVLHGITKENLPETLVRLLAQNNGAYSFISLNSYSFADGAKTEINELGKMELS